MKNLKENPGWLQSWNGGVYEGLRVLAIVWLFWAVFPVWDMGVGGVILALVCWVKSAEEVVNVGWGAIMLAGVLT